MNACYHALGDAFFEKVAGKLWNDAGSIPTWRVLEVSLFMLRLIKDDVKKVVMNALNSEAFILRFLEKLMDNVLYYQRHVFELPQLCIETCNFFSSIAYLFSVNCPPCSASLKNYFPSIISYLCACLSTQCSELSAEALCKLTSVATPLLHADMVILSEITTIASCYIAKACSPVVTLVMALGTATASLHSTAKVQIVEYITNVIAQRTSQEYSTLSTQSCDRLVRLLRTLCAFIKCNFNSEVNDDDDANGYLLEFASKYCSDTVSSLFRYRYILRDAGYELICDEIFHVHSVVIKCQHVGKWRYITPICTIIATHSGTNLCHSSLQCAYDVVEVMSTCGDKQEVLFQLLQSIVHSTNHLVDDREIDVHAVEMLYEYISLHFVLASPVITRSSDVLQALLAISGKLLKKYSEVQVIRNIFVFVQHCFTPVRTSRSPEFTYKFISETSMKYLSMFVGYILDGLDGGVSSSLWPYLADTMYVIVSAIDVCQMHDMYDVITSEIHSSLRFRKLPPQIKIVLSEQTVALAGGNKRKFKTIYTDVGKVCAGEMNSEVLYDYS